MKKIISILLAVLMIFSSMAVMASASVLDCNCGDAHKDTADCCCCVYCPTTSDNYRTSCGGTCCAECTGLKPCSCCSCCAVITDENLGDNESILDNYITDKDKESFVEGFQSILKVISDFFDNLFDTIFEFLRLDEVLGRDTNA